MCKVRKTITEQFKQIYYSHALSLFNMVQSSEVVTSSFLVDASDIVTSAFQAIDYVQALDLSATSSCIATSVKTPVTCNAEQQTRKLFDFLPQFNVRFSGRNWLSRPPCSFSFRPPIRLVIAQYL